MTIAGTSKLSFRPIKGTDAPLFMKLSKKKKYRSLVGTGEKENRDMAYAYEVNSRDYPLANIIETATGEPAGIIILENAGHGRLEVNMITEKVPDYYTTLVKVVEICQTEKVPALFVANAPGAPTYKDMVKAIASVPDVKVLSIGTKESPEYKIEL